MPDPTHTEALPSHESEDTAWLLAFGDDGKSSRLVIGWTALRRAWLDAHRFDVDHDKLTDDDRETLSLLDDDDQWSHDNDRLRFSLHVSYEGDWISVTRVDDLGGLSTASEPGGVPEPMTHEQVNEAARKSGLTWFIPADHDRHLWTHMTHPEFDRAVDQVIKARDAMWKAALLTASPSATK